MKLEEAKERLIELSKVSEKGAKLHTDDAELFLTDKEALETVLQEIEHLQKENEELKNMDLTTVYINGVCDEKGRWRNKINDKIKQMNTEEKIKLKKLGGTDRYLTKLEYMHKENVLQDLLKEEKEK